MKMDLVRIPPLTSSFMSNEKDAEAILKKLFVENQPYSNELKKLLVINTKDCLTNKTNPIYNDTVKKMGLKELIDNEYISLIPKIQFPEHDETKSYIIIGFDDFLPNETNHKFRDCVITFDIICHLNCWQLDNYAIRPLKIAGYIDGIMHESKLSGIGLVTFMGCSELVLNDEFSGYTLIYRAVHGYDDHLPPEEEK